MVSAGAKAIAVSWLALTAPSSGPLAVQFAPPSKKSLLRQRLSVPAIITFGSVGQLSKRAMKGALVVSIPLPAAVNDAPPLVVREMARNCEETAQSLFGSVAEMALSAPSPPAIQSHSGMPVHRCEPLSWEPAKASRLAGCAEPS